MANIDVKIDAALMRVMKGYKDALGSLTGLSPIPMASSTEKAAAAIAVCKHIIICFGLPAIIDFRMAYEILKTNVWDDMGNNAFMVFAKVSPPAAFHCSLEPWPSTYRLWCQPLPGCTSSWHATSSWC